VLENQQQKTKSHMQTNKTINSQPFTFNSRETYLGYRSAWKAEYKNLSAEIRILRLADRHRQRKEFAHLALTDGEQSCLIAADKISGAGSYVYRRQLRSARATETLVELKAAKIEAQRQYLARKAAKAGDSVTPASS
jgi:hypothetical protein